MLSFWNRSLCTQMACSGGSSQPVSAPPCGEPDEPSQTSIVRHSTCQLADSAYPRSIWSRASGPYGECGILSRVNVPRASERLLFAAATRFLGRPWLPAGGQASTLDSALEIP